MRWFVLAVVVAMLGLAGWWLTRSSVAVAPSVEVEHTTPPSPPAVHSPSPTAVVIPPRHVANSHLLVRAAWGAGPGQLGKKSDPESAPEGPMSLTVDGHGNLYVLDEVNHRVQRWSATGKLLAPIPVGGDTAQDLVLGKNGAVALLDRLGEKNLQLFSPYGKPLGEVALEGKHLPEAGGTTGLFADRDGNLYVERGHEELVRVAGPDGHSDAERPTLPGRPSRDGRVYLAGAISDRTGGLATVRALDADGQLLWQQTIALGAPILYLSLLESDGAGNVYVAGHTGRESAQPPYSIVDEKLVIVGLSPGGASRGSLELPAAPSIAESFRELAIGDDGTIYRMVFGLGGVSFETYRL